MILTHIMLTNMEAVNEFVRLTNAAEYKDLRINLLCENSEVDAKCIQYGFIPAHFAFGRWRFYSRNGVCQCRKAV